ncbi:hypothetical protein Ciccas_000201 [Cichlidogyrus casuarinus]|uniref:Uncharacterized protein n=1 Tax=Cichlidogyrus casuarinus TaxID=1844966 RepID=A0ABD2QRK6_9PLAT
MERRVGESERRRKESVDQAESAKDEAQALRRQLEDLRSNVRPKNLLHSDDFDDDEDFEDFLSDSEEHVPHSNSRGLSLNGDISSLTKSLKSKQSLPEPIMVQKNATVQIESNNGSPSLSSSTLRSRRTAVNPPTNTRTFDFESENKNSDKDSFFSSKNTSVSILRNTQSLYRHEEEPKQSHVHFKSLPRSPLARSASAGAPLNKRRETAMTIKSSLSLGNFKPTENEELNGPAPPEPKIDGRSKSTFSFDLDEPPIMPKKPPVLSLLKKSGLNRQKPTSFNLADGDLKKSKFIFAD